jgi:nucleotide-binding universal stress UspA family protein
MSHKSGGFMRGNATSQVLPARILVCLSLAPHASAVAFAATHLAHLLNAELIFLHAGESTQEKHDALAAIIDACVPAVPYSLVIEDGRIEDIAVTMAAHKGCDLIIAGAMEKEGPLSYYVGSTARKLARNAGCSVLLLPGEMRSGDGFPRIAISIDVSEASHRALDFAVDFALAVNATEFHILHEYDLPAIHTAVEEGVSRDREQEFRDEMQSMEELRLMDFLGDVDFRGLRPERSCVCGKRGHESVAYARAHEIDLLIDRAPAHKPTFWDKLFQHGIEFALEELPASYLLYRETDPRLQA